MKDQTTAPGLDISNLVNVDAVETLADFLSLTAISYREGAYTDLEFREMLSGAASELATIADPASAK